MKNKTTLKTLLIAAATFLALAMNARAQSPFVQDGSATMDENQPNVFTGTFIVVLSDTNDVSQVDIMLGTADNASDITLQTFDYDVTSGLPSGRSYTRTGNVISLGIGDFSEKNTWFARARVKDSSGNWSNYFKFIFN